MLMFGEEISALTAWLQEYMDEKYLIDVQVDDERKPTVITVINMSSGPIKSITFSELMNYEP